MSRKIEIILKLNVGMPSCQIQIYKIELLIQQKTCNFAIFTAVR